MKLAIKPFAFKPAIDRVDPGGDDQDRTLLPLGKEITHRPVERAGHLHLLPRTRNQRKRSLNAANSISGLFQQQALRLFNSKVINLVCFRLGEIDNSFNVLLHFNPLNRLNCKQFTPFSEGSVS